MIIKSVNIRVVYYKMVFDKFFREKCTKFVHFEIVLKFRNQILAMKVRDNTSELVVKRPTMHK